MYSDQMDVAYSSSESDDGGGGDMECEANFEPPRLNMKHGFIHHIRQNQIDRDNYDKQVRMSQPLKQQKSRISRLLNQPERRKHPDNQIYTPPKNERGGSGEGRLYTPPARRDSLEKKLYTPPSGNRTPAPVESRLYTPPSKRTTPTSQRTTPKSQRTTPVALKASEVAQRTANVKSPNKNGRGNREIHVVRNLTPSHDNDDDEEVDEDLLYKLHYTDRSGRVHILKVRHSDDPRQLAERLKDMADVPDSLIDALEFKIEQEKMKKAEETS